MSETLRERVARAIAASGLSTLDHEHYIKADAALSVINPHIMALSTVLYDIASEPEPSNYADAAIRFDAIVGKARKVLGWEPGKDRS